MIAWRWLLFLASLAVLHTAGAQGVNVAQGKTITASATLYGTFPASNLVDGSPNTFTHPAASSGTTGFTYELDLGATYALSSIVLRNRGDGCCPERLSNVSIRVFAAGAGAPGVQNWAATLRADGSNSGVGGVDTLVASANPTGNFSGRYVRIVNLSGAGYNPQVAEVEVYAVQPPVIQSFTADDDTLSTGQSAVLSWNVSGATSLVLNPGNVTLTGSTGTRSVSPTSSTTYTLTATNGGGTANATLNVGVNVTLLPPVLNEFLAENDGGLKDEDDESSDWIELKNPNSYRLDVDGYALTDTANLTARWVFPAGARIAANGYLVVFASGKNRVNPATSLHTSFKLANGGGYLALLERDGTTVMQQFPSNYPSATQYPAQFSNISYGVNGSGTAGYLKPPTPGAANGTIYSEVVAAPVFSVTRGFYESTQSLSLSTTTPGASIRYTTDGSPPTEATGTAYSAGTFINIATTATLRAAAFKSGAISSDVKTHTYLFLNSVIASPLFNWANGGSPTDAEKLESLRDLPSVSVVTSNTLNTTSPVAASIEWLRPDGVAGFQENCGVENYGNSANSFQKKAIRVSMRSEFGAPSLSYPIYEGFEHGMRAVSTFDTLDFRAGEHDMRQRGFYMANIFTDDTMLETGTVYPHGRFVHMYLNGLYHGVYQVREHWDAQMAARYMGGSSNGYETINGNTNISTNWSVGSLADGDGSAWSRIQSLRSSFTGLQPYLDITEYTDWMLMWMFGRCEGEYRIAGPSGPGSGFKLFLNDADSFLKASDSTWDGWGDRTVYTAAGSTPTHLSGDGPGDVFSGLFNANLPDHRVFLADRIYKAYFNNGVLSPARNDARLRARCLQVEKALRSECARWYSVSTTNFRTYASWLVARDSVLNTWMPPNTATVLGNFRTRGFYPALSANREAPVLNQQGGIVASGFQPSFTGPSAPSSAKIYYTLDGSDPRLSGGAIAPGAQLFTIGSSPALSGLTKNTLIKARHKNGTEWSALNEVFFQVGPTAVAPGDVVVSELHYHPVAGDSQEFIELRNVGTRAVNLAGASFTKGIDFTFSTFTDTFLCPGKRLILVKDLYTFRALRGTTLPVAGIYSGSLDNAGERVTLASAATGGTTLDSFVYDNTSSWPSGADGGGYSLTRILPATFDPGSPTAWRASTALDGTPGGTDGVIFSGSPLADTDGDGICSILEYAMGTNANDAASGRSALVVGRDALGRVTLSFPHHLLTEDVLCVVEVSTDMVTWSPAEFAGRSGTSPTVTETWRSPNNPGSQAFMRLRVSVAP